MSSLHIETHSGDLLSTLPDAVAERVRPISSGPTTGGFVLVWMRTAVRAHDNPALDAAILAGTQLGLPVFVYHALSERYPYASDRHHRFILEGARDVALQLAERGLGTAFHLERPGHRGPHLRTLARRAALVVTEDLPVPPLTGWTAALRDAVDTPIWAVDTACVLPMQLVDRSFMRAYAFRDTFKAERALRLRRRWMDAPVSGPPFVPADLPFEPVDLQSARLADLIASCEIDHTVAPVPHTRGGTAAGRARWEAFCDGGGLDRYASTRNAAQKDGTSRMSAYLHYGMVSPFRLAAECASRGGRGAAKFLDELLIWREVAHAWCSHQVNLHSLDVLPSWAVDSLVHCQSDLRPRLPSHDTLSRGRTGDRLWDACQHSLLRHGELHNNVRMTWGKQLLQWTDGPEHARSTLVDLNHRYALDGRDPSSYGGLYWCLGLFDRPFSPSRPITGRVRGRDTEHHARRMPLQRYIDRVHRPVYPRQPTVAVIGAGVAGLSCARVLADHGLSVTVFEAADRLGGRLAGEVVPGTTRAVDMGVQYVTARTPTMRRWLDSLVHDGRAAVWDGRFGRADADGVRPELLSQPRIVGLPDLSALADHLATDLSVRLGTCVAPPEPVSGGWRLLNTDGEALGLFDMLVVAAPPLEAASLLAGAPVLQGLANSVEMVPSTAVGMMFASGLSTAFDAIKVADGPIGWLARDSSKPGRPAGEIWVAQCTGLGELNDLKQAAVDEARRLLGTTQSPTFVWARQWTAARVHTPPPRAQVCVFDPEQSLGLCGDWLCGRDVGAAWRSGTAMAGQLLGELAETRRVGAQAPLFAPAAR